MLWGLNRCLDPAWEGMLGESCSSFCQSGPWGWDAALLSFNSSLLSFSSEPEFRHFSFLSSKVLEWGSGFCRHLSFVITNGFPDSHPFQLLPLHSETGKRRSRGLTALAWRQSIEGVVGLGMKCRSRHPNATFWPDRKTSTPKAAATLNFQTPF